MIVEMEDSKRIINVDMMLSSAGRNECCRMPLIYIFLPANTTLFLSQEITFFFYLMLYH